MRRSGVQIPEAAPKENLHFILLTSAGPDKSGEFVGQDVECDGLAHWHPILR